MGVLPAVLPHAGHIALDVAGIVGVSVEGWGQEADQTVVFGDQVCAPPRPSPAPRAVGGGHAGEHRPGLHQGVDPALVVLRGSQGRAVVVVAAAVPVAVPAGVVQGLADAIRGRPGSGSTRSASPALLAERQELAEGRDTERTPSRRSRRALRDPRGSCRRSSRRCRRGAGRARRGSGTGRGRRQQCS